MVESDSEGEDLDDIEWSQPISFSGNTIMTTVTSQAQQVRDWIREVVIDNPYGVMVGLDIRLGAPQPPFIPNTNITDPNAFAPRPVVLLLLCVNPKCLIFDLPFAKEIPRALSRFLSDPNHTFVGVGIEAKLEQLEREFGIGGRAREVDLAKLATFRYARPQLRNAGLNQLRMAVFGSYMERQEVDDIWDEGDLSQPHVRHACIDAYTCYEIGFYLLYVNA